VTTGASNDLQQVRNIARRMVAQWGYSKDKLGATSWESPDGNGGFGPAAASAVVEARIDEEVTQLCADAYAACKTMLLDNRILLDELTEMLVEKETVDYQEMQGLIGKYYPDGVNEKMVMPAEAALM
jgi:cell division protease FtsH